MYQEIKSDSLGPIFQAIEAAIVASAPLAVMLKKRDNGYEVSLFQIAESSPTAT